MHFSIDRTVHTTAFDKPVVDHWFCVIFYMHHSTHNSTDHGALAGTRKSTMVPPRGIDPTNYCTMSGLSTTDKGRKEMFYLTTRFIYGNMASDILLW